MVDKCFKRGERKGRLDGCGNGTNLKRTDSALGDYCKPATVGAPAPSNRPVAGSEADRVNAPEEHILLTPHFGVQEGLGESCTFSLA